MLLVICSLKKGLFPFLRKGGELVIKRKRDVKIKKEREERRL